MDQQVLENLRASYDRNASTREKHPIAAWKLEDRQAFLNLLQGEGKHRLLEIGAGVGLDGAYFQQNGMDVTCTDLSPKMVTLCRAKGLPAYAMDFLSLDFPAESFDAVYALNCLLHVPKANFRQVLQTIQDLLKIDGLFYLGMYGGNDFEGIWDDDACTPKRFYSFHTDTQLQATVSEFFQVVSFTAKDVDPHRKSRHHHFQSVILRRI